MQLHEWLASAAAYLESRRVDEPGVKSELLAGHVVRCRRLELPLRKQQELTPGQRGALQLAVDLLAGGKPLQYVLGETEFMGHVLRTDSRALIPRPETELLVEWVLGDAELWKRSRPLVADVGTGSGCIVISLALAHPEAECLGTDRSAAALELARENAQRLGVESRITFSESDLLEGVLDSSLDAVVSNPPYVSSSELDTLSRDIRDHEPRMALDGGPGGLDVVARLIPQAFRTLKPAGRLYMEIGEDQGSRVRALLEKAGFVSVAVRKDLAGHDRMVSGQKAG